MGGNVSGAGPQLRRRLRRTNPQPSGGSCYTSNDSDLQQPLALTVLKTDYTRSYYTPY